MDGYDIRVFIDSGDLPEPPRTWGDLWRRPSGIPVDKITFHPMADHDSFDYNVAVLKLRRPVEAQPIPFIEPLSE